MADEWVRALDEGRYHGVNAAGRRGHDGDDRRRVRRPCRGPTHRAAQPDRTDPLKRWLEREGRPLAVGGPGDYKTWIEQVLEQTHGVPAQA